MSGLHPRDVSAVLVTRGDVNLQPIIDSLPYGETWVWNNAATPLDAKTFGRWLCAHGSANKVWYFQDDDVIFTEHTELLRAHRPGLATLNMPSPWFEAVQDSWEGTGVPLGMFGGGALVPRYLARAAFGPYLARWPSDDLFLELCDLVAGSFIPWQRVDLGFEELPVSTAPNRICQHPAAPAKRQIVKMRVQSIVSARSVA